MHSVDLPTTVTHARDFEAAELEANHAQAVNLVMNRSSELDSKLKQFSESINQKLKGYLHLVSHGSQKHVFAITVVNKAIFELIAILIATNDWEINTEILIATTNLSTASISTSSLSTAATSNLSTAAFNNLSAAAPNNLLVSTINPNTAPKLSYNEIRKPEIQNCSKLEISNDAIFPFELKKLLTMPLFSGAALEEKPITAMYTNVKIDGHPIKLILDSGSAGSIIT
ncbi:hypothetical protein G9A89_021246 [Geosiphon pyriformis]|nr:hypothetical protein G9A89_021246 [Geosiphon pyriformis]